MFKIEIIHSDGSVKPLEVPDECVAGSSPRNDVHLDSWRVSKQHARFMKTPSGVLIEDMGSYLGLTVNGMRVTGQHGPLTPSDVISIGPYKLRVAEMPAIGTNRRAPSSPDRRAKGVVREYAGVERRRLQEDRRANAAAAGQVEALHVSAAPPAAEQLGQHHSLPDRHSPRQPRAPAPAPEEPARTLPPLSKQKQLEFEWRGRLHAALLERMDLRRHDVSKMSDAQLREETNNFILDIIGELQTAIPPELDRELLAKQVLDEAVGLGPLEELLEDNGVTEIMVNQFDKIFVERKGRLERHPLTFTSDRAVLGVIERIVTPLGRRIDESSPMVDARLKDGSRVNAIIPPLALKGPTLTIRKFAKRKMTAQDLVDLGSMSAEMAEFLEVCVAARRNIVVSGGTGSGKTTLLNILSNFIPHEERIITVEDAAELQLHHDHWVSLESRPANGEGKGAIPIRELVRNTLRMRPDRIVVGECRGGEALDMLQAMNTGHDGSLTTLHANSPRDGLARLETMVLMAGMDLPLTAIRDQIASAIHLIVQQTRFACGTRMVTSITEVTGIESGKLQLQELFRFANQGYGNGTKIRGYFTGCDMAPTFYEALRFSGRPLDMDIFKPVVANVEMDDGYDEVGEPELADGGFSHGAAG
ncbi:ATPase, T2SS/T4P/T4SS family [Massilia solisilvae]|uniref:ATPase, T2SS/T4P/T4SS family n=1 Tax=Massilia solisilvae TaxID=1811225 RepID=A0ABT2BDR5_9BURK|nr:ATPase, T2SS/T4P/T4SS family [Massilia solisilvae]MCS0606664.1 ATPase, T2SS/T4P/T4SS family [Massilia solisilvae]